MEGVSNSLLNTMQTGARAQMEEALQKSKTDRVMNALAKTRSGQETELKSLARDFESMVINMMIKSMRDSVPEEDGLFGTSNETTTYRELLDEEYSKTMSERGGFGISELLYRQLADQVNAAEPSKTKTESLK